MQVGLKRIDGLFQVNLQYWRGTMQFTDSVWQLLLDPEQIVNKSQENSEVLTYEKTKFKISYLYDLHKRLAGRASQWAGLSPACVRERGLCKFSRQTLMAPSIYSALQNCVACTSH